MVFNPWVIFCAGALALGILVFFASQWPAASSAPATRMPEECPAAVVRAFLAAANEGRYSDAQRMLSEGARHVYIKGGGDGGPVIQPFPIALGAGGFRGICDQITKNGSIAQVVIVKEETGGGVTVDITFKDGSTLEGYEFILTEEEGAWKLLTLEMQREPQQ